MCCLNTYMMMYEHSSSEGTETRIRISSMSCSYLAFGITNFSIQNRFYASKNREKRIFGGQ